MDGSRKTMAERNVGDSVRVGKNEFSRVFMFTHKVVEGTKSFVTIATAEGRLDLTAGHYLYVNGALSSAGSVKVGDAVTMASGRSAAVETVGSVQRPGLYSPPTVSGNIVVDGVLAST